MAQNSEAVSTPTQSQRTTSAADAAVNDQSCVRRSSVVARCEPVTPRSDEPQVRPNATNRAAQRSEEDTRARAIASQNLQAAQLKNTVYGKRAPTAEGRVPTPGAVVVIGYNDKRAESVEQKLSDAMNPVQLDTIIVGSGNGTQHSWTECPPATNGQLNCTSRGMISS